MAKPRTTFRCSTCGEEAPQWVGRCPGCGDWSTMAEERLEPAARGDAPVALRDDEVPMPIAEVDSGAFSTTSTGVPELDRVLGGGFVPGSATLVGGEPGVGKSTLLLQVAMAMATGADTVLYLSAEESMAQVRDRAERLGPLPGHLQVSAAQSLPAIEAAVDASGARVVIIDSIQTIHDPGLGSAPGTVGQVRECAGRLVQLAKRRSLVLVLVGHVTKDGALAGPRVLEHLVDTVLSIDGDRQHALRLVRAVKHRFGSTHELGVLEMTGVGLQGVADASGLFLADRRPGVPGSVVVPTVEGARSLLVEVQALVVRSPLATPRRSAQGVDSGRLALLLGVLANRAGCPLGDYDVFASVVGGVRLQEPAVDLGLSLALVSALVDVALPSDVVVVGEVGLGGEVRQVAGLDRRLAEAARLGFRRAIVPEHHGLGADQASGITLHPVDDLRTALLVACLVEQA